MVIFRRIPNCISHLLLRITSSQRSQFLSSFILGALFAVSVRLYQVGLSQIGRYGGRSKNDSSFEDTMDQESEAYFLHQSVNVHCLVLPLS